jgi:hypothetical protein
MTMEKKPNRGTAWYGKTPGHGGDQPTARTGGSGMPGVSAPHDPKHAAATTYQFGTGSGASRPAPTKDPQYVSHANQRVDEGRRIGTRPNGGPSARKDSPLPSRNARVRGK